MTFNDHLITRGKHLTALTVNKNRKLLAFAQKGDRPHVVVFDLAENKRKKVKNSQSKIASRGRSRSRRIRIFCPLFGESPGVTPLLKRVDSQIHATYHLFTKPST